MLLTWRAGREQAVAVQAADTGRERCTQRLYIKAVRKDGGAPPGLVPVVPLLFSSSTLLAPSTLHRVLKIGAFRLGV